MTRNVADDRYEYSIFIEDEIERYKDSISRADLLKIGDEAVAALHTKTGRVPEFGTRDEFLLIDEVDRIIRDRLQLPSFAAWRKEHDLSARQTPAMLDVDGQPVTDGNIPSRVIVQVSEIDALLLQEVSRNPQRIHELTPRKFEYLIAELLTRDGWEVEITPASRDGGKDLVAKLNTSGICSVYYVECKRYAVDKPVSVKVVRELLGIIHADRVTAGMVVTTSSFTRPAFDLQKEEPHRISLKAYTEIHDWLIRCAGPSGKKEDR
jgi:HJR/Mrr/RecB family endonuclease